MWSKMTEKLPFKLKHVYEYLKIVGYLVHSETKEKNNNIYFCFSSLLNYMIGDFVDFPTRSIFCFKDPPPPPSPPPLGGPIIEKNHEALKT